MYGAVVGFVIALITALCGVCSYWWLLAGVGGGLFIEFLCRISGGAEIAAVLADIIGSIGDIGDIVGSIGDSSGGDCGGDSGGD